MSSSSRGRGSSSRKSGSSQSGSVESPVMVSTSRGNQQQQPQQQPPEDDQKSINTSNISTSSQILANKGESVSWDNDDGLSTTVGGASMSSSVKAAQNKPPQLRRGNLQTGREEVRPGAYHQAGIRRPTTTTHRQQVPGSTEEREDDEHTVPEQQQQQPLSAQQQLDTLPDTDEGVASTSDVLIMATLVEDRPEMPVVQATKLIEAEEGDEPDDSSIPGNDEDDLYADEDKRLQDDLARRKRRRCWYVAGGVVLVAAIAGGVGGAMAFLGGGGDSSANAEAQSQNNNGQGSSAPTLSPFAVNNGGSAIIPTSQPTPQATFAVDDPAWFDQFSRVSFHSMVYESELSHCAFVADSQDNDPEIFLSCSGENSSILLVDESSEGQMDCSRESSDQIVCSLINSEENDEFVDHWLVVAACGTDDELPSQDQFDQGNTMTFLAESSILVAEDCSGDAVDTSQQISGQVTTYQADGFHEITLGHFCFEQNVADPDVVFFFEDPSFIQDDCVVVELCTDPDDAESCSGSLCNLELDDIQVQDAIDRSCFLIKQDGASEFEYDIDTMTQAVDTALALRATRAPVTPQPSSSPSEFPSEWPSKSPSKFPSESPSKVPTKAPVAPTSPNTSPTAPPVTAQPSASPTKSPTRDPTMQPVVPPVASTDPPTFSPLSPTDPSDPAWYDRYERISFHAVEYESSTFECSSVEADEPDHIIPEIYLECVEENSSIILAYESSEGVLDCWRESESTVGCTLENSDDGFHEDYLLVLVACGTNDALPSQSEHEDGLSMTFLPYISSLFVSVCDGLVILTEEVDGFTETTYEAIASQSAVVGEFCFEQGVTDPEFTLDITHDVTRSSSCQAVESCEDPEDFDTCTGDSLCEMSLGGISASDNPSLDCFMIKQEGQVDFNFDIDQMVLAMQNSRR